ncbi:MAG: histidine kinase N-terminal 7TM domain-containing protein [Chloroflexota bacterium]
MLGPPIPHLGDIGRVGAPSQRTNGMLSPSHLEVAAHSLTAILGIWLGLTVLTRSRTAASRAFGILALSLVAWSSSVIIERLSTAQVAIQVGHSIEELAAAIVVPATFHFALVIATEGHPTRLAVRFLALAYLVNVAFAIPGALNPLAPISIAAPQLSLGFVPGVVLGWAWILTRLTILVVSIRILVRAYRGAHQGEARRRDFGVTLATVAIGAIGGSIRILNVVGQTDAWVGVSMITIAMILSASVVFSGGVFFEPEVADRAFRRSLSTGIGLFALVGALLVVDAASRSILGLDAPLFIVLTLVIAVAMYEPVSSWSRARLGGRSPSVLARDRMLAALRGPGLLTRAADAGVQPALARLTHVLDLAGAVVVGRDGTVLATEGTPPSAEVGASINLVSANELVGELRVGRRISGVPLGAEDENLLRLSASYVAAALRTGRREEERVTALAELTGERANVDLTANDLHQAFLRRSAGRAGLHVFALGTLRVERDGAPIERWGGEKAGTRQAEALFAFLFDRGERGVEKDEVLELIWPDVDVERADLAFHRTLGGLRHVIDPDGSGGKRAIRFHNDRYRLDPSVVAWSDVATFLSRLDAARSANAPADRLRLMEEAREVYRGEYLDDCPFYGDSVHVDERRVSLRGRQADLLVALGEIYEAAGDRSSAAAAFRDAVSSADDGSPSAEAGLLRLARRT